MLERLPYPGNWQKPVSQYFRPRVSAAILLHPFFQLPNELIPVLAEDEYQRTGSADGLMPIRWSEMVARLDSGSLSNLAQALSDFIFRNLEAPREPVTLNKLLALRPQGILLPDSNSISDFLIPTLRTVLGNKSLEETRELNRIKVLSSTDQGTVVVCLADQFFSYVAGPTEMVSRICEHPSLECARVPGETPLLWYKSKQ